MRTLLRMRRLVSNLRTGLVGVVLIALVPALGVALAGGISLGPRGILFLLATIALSLVAAWAWSRLAILGPVDAIVGAARRMSRGDLSARSGLEALGGDLGQLSRAFDEMAASLEARESEASRSGAALRDSHQTLQAILTAAPLAIIAFDRQGRLMLWNPAAERMFGFRSDEVLGRPMPWVPEDKRSESIEFIRRATSGERLSGTRMRRQRKDGRPIDLRVFTAPLRRPDGTIYGTVGLIEDVTEQKVLEDQLHRSQKMQAVGRLAGGLAHDFNNLLTVIRGYAELALRKSDPGAPIHVHLTEVRNAALRANTLTRQLLTFSRQPLGEPRVLDLNRTLEETSTLLGPLIGEDVRLVLEPGPDAGHIRADSGQLAQILTNLVVNARDAMPRGGEIRIRTGRVETGGAAGRALADLPPGEYCVISVADTGRGMDADTLQHVFEPFFSTKDVSQGAGLGLSTVYGIVAQSGGDIRVESEPGRGSVFHVYLPRVNPDAAGEASTSGAPETPIRGSGTILLVEDEPEVRSVIRETLEIAGYKVVEAAGGREALELGALHPEPIDLLLTDVVMPELSGPEVAGRLVEQRPGMRVLFISGYAPVAADTALHAFPGTAFIPKPFDLEALTRKVHELLSAPEDDARAA